MELISLSGRRKKYRNVHKYRIDWDGGTRSKFQSKVKGFLKPFWKLHVVFEEFPIIGTRMTLDLYNANKRVAIEVQGRQHQEFVKHFHGDLLNFGHQLRRDAEKERFCELNNIALISIFDEKEISKEFFESLGVYL
jgi:hypothetical protein